MSTQTAPHIALISSAELASSMGYSGTNSAFRDWCASMRIAPVPGRRGYFDPALVRRRLDEAQGLSIAGAGAVGSLVSQRRARNATQ